MQERKMRKTKLLGNQVYQQLRDAILKGELKPGSRLLVLELSARFGVSQAPVREALGRLRQEGLILFEDNKGSVVSDISIEEIQELYELRQLIEGYAVRETLKTMVPADVDKLEQIYNEMKQAGEENNLTRFIELDIRFHDYFYENCRNRAVLNVWKHIRVQLMRFMFVSNQIYFANIGEVADSHIGLLSALRAGDPERIEKLFIEHMRTVWWRMKQT
jgi:DNA-binding GntR family transcriptional regulator